MWGQDADRTKREGTGGTRTRTFSAPVDCDVRKGHTMGHTMPATYQRVTKQPAAEEGRAGALSRGARGMGAWGQRCIGKGRTHPPPPSRAHSLCPATVPLTPSASLNGICYRQ